MSKAILGGTLTTQADGKTSTNALGEVHNEVRHDILTSDAAQIAATITRQILAPLAYLNCGVSDPALLPYFRFDTRQAEDIQVFADALPKLAAVMDIPAAWAHEKLKIPQAEEGEKVLAMKDVSAPQPPAPLTAQARADGGKADPFPDQTAIDGMAPDAALSAASAELLAPLLTKSGAALSPPSFWCALAICIRRWTRRSCKSLWRGRSCLLPSSGRPARGKRPMETPDLVYALGLPPRDAVAYLESKGIRPSRHWYDIWQEAQAKAVTVSGMTRLDLLEDVKKGLVDAVKNGTTGKMFIDDLAPILRAKGWTGKRQSINPKTGEVTEKGPDLPARLSLIFFRTSSPPTCTGVIAPCSPTPRKGRGGCTSRYGQPYPPTPPGAPPQGLPL
ncbi:MAG: DUF935 family protein [Bilophila wadsworthia]